MFRRTLCDYPVLARVSNAIRGVEIGCYDAIASIMSGQEVNPESRVRLGNELDRFGMRRINLDWRLTERDKRTLRVAALELGKQLIGANAGRLKINEWLLDPKLTFPTTAQEEVGGCHHMCTTRMSDDPKSGVVDRDCRLHSADNLYLGGSSVFATPGYCNPTFTIVQLALRLADHLDGRLRANAI
jgi:choline dehydrogenase-like flavoprotein